MLDTLRRSSYSFLLPPEQIAQEPPPDRGASRLFVFPRSQDSGARSQDSGARSQDSGARSQDSGARSQGSGAHHSFSELPDLLRSGDLLVLNDTRVLAARVLLRRASGGGVPGLLLETPNTTGFQMMLEGRGKLSVGDSLRVVDVSDGAEAGEVGLLEKLSGGVWLASGRDRETCDALLQTGRMPLPPYIRRSKREPDPRDDVDHERYQTVFAARSGAVAAPTAGLHFTDAIFRQLAEKGVSTTRVTLHVGPGTFLPVRADDLREHQMHAERFSVPEETAAEIRRTRAEGRRVIAVGTTVVRTLEASFDEREGGVVAGSGETDLFIHPPYKFRVVDGMITNFHLPESTLLMLVSAFCGRERLLKAYEEAVRDGYRFFSYGDAMFLDGEADPAGVIGPIDE